VEQEVHQIQERDARNLANVETSSGNLLNLINDILDLSRIEAGGWGTAGGCAHACRRVRRRTGVHVKERVELHRELADVGHISYEKTR